jgi:hypothetical protein
LDPLNGIIGDFKQIFNANGVLVVWFLPRQRQKITYRVLMFPDGPLDFSQEGIAAIGIPIILAFDVLGDVLAYFT